MKNSTPFRNWLNIIWQENCREHEDFGQLPYTLPEYWARYKYWLKREFRHQQRHANRN